jgi:hypothetical protein
MKESSTNEFHNLCEDVREGKVVFWVGAGFSSYAGYPSGMEFTKYLQHILGIQENEEQALSVVSEKFKNREELLNVLKSVYGKEPEHDEIHKSLSLLPHIPYIITTNYDMLFERAYGDKIHSIAEECELPTTAGISQKTFIYKIHGDISHLDRIIITSEDYQHFDEDSILWGKIKTILAEFSVVFIGYSLKDRNVRTLLELILRQIGKQKNPYYYITRDLTEEKREFLKSFSIIPIEIEGNEAVNRIKEYVAKYAFNDVGTNPTILAKNTPLLTHKGVKISSTIDDGKISACTVNAIPDSGVKSTAVCQKLPTTPESEEMAEWFDTINGVKFDPVIVTDPWSKLNLQVKTGDVFILNPGQEKLKLETVTLKAQPKNVYTADLQINDMRLSNITVKEFESETHTKIIFRHENFCFSFYAAKIHPGEEATLKFGLTAEDELLDIERTAEFYTFIKKWIDGSPMHLIRTPHSLSQIIEPLPLRDTDLYGDIEFRQKLFEIFSNIQKYTKIKLEIPETISQEDFQNIFRIGEFLEGKKQHQEKIPSRMTPRDPKFLEKLKDLPQITVEGVMDFILFGQRIPLRYIVEGTDWMVENYEDVIAQAQKGILPLNVVLKSRNNDLFLRFNASP